MKLKPIAGFKNLETHHCCTGSIQHIYEHNDHPLSEDMLLGIGGGVGFMYWHSKGTMPFMGGRGKGRPKQQFEVCVGERSGVLVGDFTTSSAKKAESALIGLLEEGQPVMVQCDMGFLPYFYFGGEEYHFGGHFVVVCGYDPDTQTILVADRDDKLYTISLADLAKARGSIYPPFAPKNRWFTFDFSKKRLPTPEDIRLAISEQAEEMINPPISNFGVKGIRKAAKQLVNWPDSLEPELLKATMFNSYIFIDAAGGTGGGLFRYMFSRFLREAAERINEPGLEVGADQFKNIGDRWQEVANLFKRGVEEENLKDLLLATSEKMLEIAALEENSWSAVSGLI